MPKTSSIRLAVLVEHRLVTDRWTDRQTQAQYRECLTSRGKTRRGANMLGFLYVSATSEQLESVIH